jgi:hypothetical protein
MDVAPPVRQILVKFRNALYDAHHRFFTSLSSERHKADAGRCQRESALSVRLPTDTALTRRRRGDWVRDFALGPFPS